ncbi:MAG TPA: RES family NAD+ phosphorylase [Candidatus Elarobacter sp.]
MSLVDGDPDDLESLLETLGLTDPRMRDAAAAFAALPPAIQYRGPSAAAVMMPFLCPGESRFSSGRYGVLYGGEHEDTAAAEVAHHQARRLRATRAPTGTAIVLALWAFWVDTALVDLRAHDRSIYDPDDYSAARTFGAHMHRSGEAGVLYSSVRRPSGTCLGIFVPNTVAHMEKRDDWRMVWDGTRISEVLRVH